MSDRIFAAREHHAAPSARPAGAAGPIPLVLRLEAALGFAAAVIGYRMLGGAWSLFALLFLLPDLGMIGYLRNPRLGAAIYNAAHTTAAPGALAALGWASGAPAMILVALVWAAHIGFDRMLGYGLKRAAGFNHTHLS